MRSHELAALAGVSVRTLRHYHRVGVLAEPRRSGNGYRDYTVHDLVRLLRIRRLAALGTPLDRMTAVLDAEQPDHRSVLDELEADVDARISRLQQQKELLGLIRGGGLPPDLPPELGRATARSTVPGLSSSAARADREHVVLLAHLAGRRGVQGLVDLAEHLAEPTVRAAAVGVTRDLDQLDADADAAAIDAVVDRITARLAPVAARLRTATDAVLPEGARARELLRAHRRDAFNPAQRAALARVDERVRRTLDGPG